MPAVTLDTLPLDVLDFVFQFLEEDLSDVGRTSRLKAFHRLCLVNRTLLPLAGRFLYSKPLAGHPRTWKSAIGLALTLKQRNNTFGRLVFDLVDLPSWLNSLSLQDTSAISLSFQVRGQTKAYSWFLAMLEACPQAKHVGLVFSSPVQLSKAVRSLSSCLPTPRTVKLQSVTNCTISGDLFHKFANKVDFEEVEQFEVVSVNVAAYPSPKLPFRVRTLVLTQVGAAVAPQFFPTQLSPLTSLVLKKVAGTPVQVLTLVQLAAPTLTHLNIDPGVAESTRSYRNYGLLHDGPNLLPKLFSTLPKIRFLKLTSHKALSVQRLEALAANSPKLVELVLTESVWVADDPSSIDKSLSGWQARVFPELDLAATFRRFKHLERVDLGVVPYKSAMRPVALLASLDEQGVEVDYQLCTDACPSCGMVHYDW
ncbi:hypothetical protein JCM8097_007132 [Rhodosporidiobolus ruineniae]